MVNGRVSGWDLGPAPFLKNQINMKKKKYSYLKDYQNWMIDGKMPNNGLCNHYGDYEHLELMTFISPNSKEKDELFWQNNSHLFWGSDSHKENRYVFTPLRQNLVLLMAALNNEL